MNTASQYGCVLILLCGILCGVPGVNVPGADNDEPTTASKRVLTAEEQSELLDEIKDELGSVDSLKTEFRQERHLTTFMDTLTARGTCYFNSPDMLRWGITEPYVALLIYNHGKVAKFDMENGELRKLKLGMDDMLQQVLQQILAWMRGDFASMGGNYTMKIVRSEQHFLLHMVPSSKELRTYIESIEFTIDPETYHITLVVIREPGGDYIEIDFFDETVNPSLSDRLFDLKKPLLDAGK